MGVCVWCEVALGSSVWCIPTSSVIDFSVLVSNSKQVLGCSWIFNAHSRYKKLSYVCMLVDTVGCWNAFMLLLGPFNFERMARYVFVNAIITYVH